VELSARYLSFEGTAFRLRVGLRPLDPAEWLELDEHYDEYLAEKAALLRSRHDEVVAVVDASRWPVVDAACEDTLALVVAHLDQHHAGLVAHDAGTLRNTRTGEDLAGIHPIDAAGRLVQEDLVVLLDSPGGPVLAAASLCFPSRWHLHEKLGRTMAAIHEPVPGYASSIAAPTDAALARLSPERPVWRLNWSLHDDPALFQPEGHGRADAGPQVTAEDAGATVWFRVERQTLRRLPTPGAVLFTIRTHQWPLAELAGVPGACAQLASTLRSVPPDFAVYKSLPGLTPAVLGWLDARS
jgi:hypothetical protein